ncbi:hypothetical protein JNUCC0626_48415 [Lentzea sp. JNUCC 0626]|uniref:hypothetical protein n=1 Tax=Lentzea sp. JNUCC 0626 TaxID=3367513 RepID=UPI003747BFA4
MTGGGAATNSGIDFQHRFGALAMLSVLAGVDLVVDDLAGSDVTDLRFETRDGIDDVVIETRLRRYLVQAKRSLSLSGAVESEYSSVLRQFVRQHLERPEMDDRYVLATSYAASKSIRQDLRKLTESARLNPGAHGGNPMSANERAAFETTRALIEHHHEQLSGKAVDEQTLSRILGRVVVTVLDVEAGGAHERAAVAVIASRSKVAPAVVWQSLVARCLSLAKNRQSVTAERLVEMMGGYFGGDEVAPEVVDGVETQIVFTEDVLLSGREIVLAELGGKLLLAEIFRFDDDGTKRVRFAGGNVYLGGEPFPLLRRASTVDGILRLIAANPELTAGREIVVTEINSSDDFDGSPIALAHAALCRRLWEQNPAPFSCLVCARPVSDSGAHLVELDEEDVAPAVGLAHGTCLRPAHRVLGGLRSELFETHPHLRDFDYNTWFRVRPRSQGFFNSAEVLSRGPVRAFWKPDRDRYAVGTWGVGYELEDGRRYYSRNRGRVLRYSLAGAVAAAELMIEHIATALECGDPYCVTQDDAFGPYSEVIRTSVAGQPVRVRAAAPVELDRATMIAHRTTENFYAPLVVLVDRDSAERFTLLGAFVLLTDPLAMKDAVANWTVAGFDVPELATVLIESDDQFDAFVAGAVLDGAGVLVDPRFDLNQSLVGGVIVEHFGSVIAAGGTPHVDQL